MAATHRWLGLGEMPTGPVVEYLARSLSAFYAVMGALCLVVAADLERYRPLVRFLGGGVRPDEPGPRRRRSGGGDAVVVVRLLGARGRGVRGAAARAGPPRFLERWNSMTPSLCETCAWMREVVTPRGSRFLLCQLSRTDPTFPKYPAQPVVRCGGYQPREANEEESKQGGNE
jgi:hypothetical protein